MTKVVFGMTMSLDGFINAADGSVGALYPDFAEFVQSDVMKESIHATGAVVMGRRTFEMAGDPDTYADNYEYQVPIFVVTEQAPAKKPKENGHISFVFVNNVELAIQQAKQAAGQKDVTVVGGPNVLQQLLKAGLVDELDISIMPVLLGEGQRLFEHLEGVQLRLTKTKLTDMGQRTNIRFTVNK